MPDTEHNGLLYINIKEFTDEVTVSPNDEVSGIGIFDVLMDTATKHITAQFGAGRIKGEDYATAYIQIYQATLGAAMQAWLQKGVAKKQLELLEAQVKSEESKKDLYKRQIQGLDEDYKQKILKICIDAWAVGFSVAKDSFQATGIPAPMQKTTIDTLYNNFIVPELDMFPDYRKGM